MELNRYLAIGRRWLWLIILMPAVSGLVTYWVDSRRAPVYQAQVQLMIGSALSSTNVDLNELRVSSQLVPVYADLVQTRPILETVIEELDLRMTPERPDLRMTPERLKSRVKAIPIEEAQVLRIQVQDPSPYRAVQIANAMADVLIARSPTAAGEAESLLRDNIQTKLLELSGNISETDTAIAELELQLQQSPGTEAEQALLAQLKGIRAQLQASYTTLTSLYAQLPTKSVNKIEVVEAAIPDLKPVSPRVTLDVLLGALVGLVAATSFAVFLEYLNDKVNSAEDLPRVIGETISVRYRKRPELQGEAQSALETLWSSDSPGADSFRILRANLHSLELLGSSRCLMVTSPEQGTGKGEFAANLAVAFKETGKYVILIEADLKAPRLAQLFDSERSNDVEAGPKRSAHEPELAIVPLKKLEGTLQILSGAILPAGSSPSVFFGSQRWQGMLEEFKSQADIVILHAPPALNRADTLILARQAGAVLLVVNHGRSTRQGTRRALEGLERASVNVIGTVLNRSTYYRAPRSMPQLRPLLSALKSRLSRRAPPAAEEMAGQVGPDESSRGYRPHGRFGLRPNRASGGRQLSSAADTGDGQIVAEANGRHKQPFGLSGLGWQPLASADWQSSPEPDQGIDKLVSEQNGRSEWSLRLPWLKGSLRVSFDRPLSQGPEEGTEQAESEQNGRSDWSVRLAQFKSAFLALRERRSSSTENDEDPGDESEPAAGLE